MSYYIYSDNQVIGKANSLEVAEELFNEMVTEAKENSLPTRIVLKDMRSFEDIETYVPY